MTRCRYGAEQSESYFSDVTMGGMAADPCIFIQSSVNISDIEQRSHGHWRIHSKLGNGCGCGLWGEITCNTLMQVQHKVHIPPLPRSRKRCFNSHCILHSRQVGEIRSNGYACFPVLDSAGRAVTNSGAGACAARRRVSLSHRRCPEFVLALRSSVAGDTSLLKAEAAIAAAAPGIIQRLMSDA